MGEGARESTAGNAKNAEKARELNHKEHKGHREGRTWGKRRAMQLCGEEMGVGTGR